MSLFRWQVGSFARRASGALPPQAFVLGSVFSVQLGAAAAKRLFGVLGPEGTVLLRVGFAAVVLLVLWRPRIKGRSRSEMLTAILFGLALALMNLSFYSAIARIPLGVAVTLEFSGPLAVAVVGSRRLVDLLWAALAAAGILLLAPLGVFGHPGLDVTGVGLALLAGFFWACYIFLNARTGRIFPGGSGLAIAMCVGAVVLLPVGIAYGGAALLEPHALFMGFAVAMLSSAIPYSLEIEALRRLPPRVFGVLMSLEPAVAALVGFMVLGESLGARSAAAVLLVTVAAAGSSFSSRK
ncbi:MAG: EamA family transporter [Rubrobacteraceae bacterium]|nr:EamA family transporter [Rubrobacteraceae bacterium]